MSRVVRRFGYAISPNGAQASTFKQAAYLREKVIEFIDSTNAEASTSRRLTRGAAFAVVHRSLVATKDLPFSIREHIAMKELSQYVTLLQNNKVAAIKPSHTDLLPVAHPRSTKMHTLTASALISARANWYADDSRITNEKVKSIVASAYTATPGSVEHSYYSAVLASLPQGSVPQDILVSLTADGNSSAERSLRARLQRRDRFGQFAEMGGGMSALIRMAKDGVIRKLTGRPVTDGPDGDDIQVELPDGRIVNIPASKGQFIPAVLERSKDGFSQTPAKVSVADNQYVINEEDLKFVDSPNGFEKVGENKWQGIDTINAGMIVEKADDGSLNVEFEFMNGSRQDVGNFSDWEDVFDGIVAWDEDLKDRSEKADAKRKKDLEEDDKRRASLPKFDDEDIQVVELDKDGKAKGPARDAFPKKFAFNYPEGAYKISKDPDADIEESYEDPTQIAQYADERDLITALEEGLLPKKEGQNATGYGNINTYDGEQIVPVENLYLALQEMGGDPELEVARIYDKQLGTSENEDNLLGSRKQETISEPTPELDKAFIRETKELGPDIEPATEEPAFDAEKFDAAPLPALLEGLSETELARFMESEDHTSYLPKNEQVEMPIGYASLSPEPYAAWKKVTAENPDANLPEGFSDNPVFIAQNIPTPELEKEFRRALEPGNDIPGTAKISLKTDSGEEFVADVPGEAVRDALQLQGVDTNALTKQIADEGFEGQKQEVVGQEQPVAKIESVEDAIRADEEYILKMRNLYGFDRRNALEKYDQKGPHDPLDPAYKGEFAEEFENYLYEDGTPNGAFNDLLRSNPDFARLFAWNQFDQTGSPIHEEWRPSDEDAFEEFPNDNFEDVDHAYIDRLYDAAPTPATAISAGLKVLMQPDYFYSSKKDKIAILQDALRAFKDGDMRSDIKDDEQELAAVESVTKSIEDEIAKLQTAPAAPIAAPSVDEDKIKELEAEREKFVKQERGAPSADMQTKARIAIQQIDAEIARLKGTLPSDPKAMGKDAFAKGKKRVASVDPDLTNLMEGKSSEEKTQLMKDWYEGYDAANISAPMDDFEVPTEQEIPDGIEADPKSPNLEPDNINGPYRIVSKVSDLQPGDITADDHFVIESVGGPFEGDPSKLEIAGYYPGHVTQNTKKWNASTEMTVIRGAQAPEKGDLPELSKPFARDFGPVYKNKEGKWSMSKAEDQAKLDAAWEEYNARKAEAIARFEDPTNKDNTKAPHQVRVKAADLQPGDVSAKPEKGHFVIERTFTDETTKPGFVSVEGYYPGHVSQRKEWKVGTDIDVIRNVEAPAKGELPEIHQPSKTNAKGNWVPDRDPAKRAEYEKEIADVASKWEVPQDLPTIEPSASDSDAADAAATKPVVVKAPERPRTPTMPAFQGEFAAIAREAGGDWDKFRELIKDREIIFFDYETTGIDPADGNEPWQLGAVKVVNGEVVDRFNVFMNPGRSIAGTYASRDKAKKPNAVDGEGNKLTDEFLASQPDQKTAHEQFAAWAGENPLLAAHNMIFDDEVARRMADKHGTPYSPAGLMDTLPIARDVLKDDSSSPTYAYNGEKDNRLPSLAAHYGISLERAHSADYDSQATAELFSKLADQAGKEKTGADLFDVDARQADWEKAQTEFQTAMSDYEQKAADFATAKAIQDALAGKKVDLDKVVADAKGAAKPNPDGQQESEKSEASTEPAIIDFESAGTYPQGKMKLMPREWAADDANTTLLPREDIRMKDLLPGDFMTSASGDHMYQIVAVRAGEDFGFQAGKVRAYRADLENGETHMIEYWQNTRLDGVRRPKNPDDLLLPEDTTDSPINDSATEGESSNQYVPVSTGSATVKVEPSEDGRYKMVATFFDDNGDVAYQVEDSYRTREGAEAEGKALIQDHVRSTEAQKAKEQGEEATKQEDTPVSRGTVPANADSAPQRVEISDLPGGFTGDIQITPSSPDKDKPEYTSDSALIDSDGDVIDVQKTVHTSRSEAESSGREFISRSADAYSSAEVPEDLGKKSSKPRKVSPERQAELDAIRISNDAVLDSTGLLPNTDAKDLRVGDFIKHNVNKVYEEIVEIYQHPTEKGKLLFRVRDPRDGNIYERKFDKGSDITNPRRPGIEDQTTEEANKRATAPEDAEKSKRKGRGYGKRSSRYSDRVIVDAAVKLNPQARANAGRYEDRMGNQLKPADEVGFAEATRVVHVSQNFRDKVGNQVGTVINFSGDQKHGGDVRDGVVYLDFIFVQFPPSEEHPNGVIRKWQANNVFPVGPNGEIPKAFEGPRNQRPPKLEYETPESGEEVILNQAFRPETKDDATPAPTSTSKPEAEPTTEKPKFVKMTPEEKLQYKKDRVEGIQASVVDRIFDDLDNTTDLQWAAKWTGILGDLPYNILTGNAYNGINPFILYFSKEDKGYSSNRWIGKKQAEKFNGVLKPDEKPTYIITVTPSKIVYKKDADGKDTDEIAYRTRQNYGYAEVYNVDQFETIDLPPVPEIPKIEASEAEEEILKRYKDHPPIEFVKMAPGQSPHYTFDKDIIKLPERGQYGDDQLGFIKTLLHELSHSSGHKDRLDRSELFDRIKIEAGLRIDNGPNRATEELMAEIAAAIIGARLGLELDTKHTSAYIKSWIRALNNNRSAIIDAASAAAKIADYILEGKKPGSGVGRYGKTGDEIAQEENE
jgi:antirestriction protein ArdC/DNA polymerase III epsilon subunit-like protein